MVIVKKDSTEVEHPVQLYTVIVRNEYCDGVAPCEYTESSHRCIEIFNVVGHTPNEALSEIVSSISFPQNTTGQAYSLEIIPSEDQNYELHLITEINYLLEGDGISGDINNLAELKARAERDYLIATGEPYDYYNQSSQSI